MKCHYEVLDIPFDADFSQIKVAYRKLALKWHPDKNMGNLEHATEQFKLVKAAYDVLSDPQDKAWYDRNRENIMQKQQFKNFDEDELNLYDYFTSSCYKGFSNDNQGFYAVYDRVFKNISNQDLQFSKEDKTPMPHFGIHNSDYESVVGPFYAAWQSYSTKLTFIWVEKWDEKEGRSRQEVRAMQKENKKERDKKRKIRNELIRELVGFVRKRDPRVKANTEKLRKLAEKNKQRVEEKRQQELRDRLKKAAEFEAENHHLLEQREAELNALEAQMKDDFGFSSDENEDLIEEEFIVQDEIKINKNLMKEIDDKIVDKINKADEIKEFEEEEDVYLDELYCAACNKNFKTSMAKMNHEKSKKHKEKVNLLKFEMLQELENDNQTQNDVVDQCKKSKKKNKKKKKKDQKMISINQDSSELYSKISETNLLDSESDGNNYAGKNEDNLLKEDCNKITSDDEDFQSKSQKKRNKKLKKKQRNRTAFFTNESNIEKSFVASELINEPVSDTEDKQSITESVAKNECTESIREQISEDNVDNLKETNKKAKLKKRRRKDKSKKSENAESNHKMPDLLCSTCNFEFPTRNQLFKHLKKTGHQALKQ